jgi:hypothetical protein
MKFFSKNKVLSIFLFILLLISHFYLDKTFFNGFTGGIIQQMPNFIMDILDAYMHHFVYPIIDSWDAGDYGPFVSIFVVLFIFKFFLGHDCTRDFDEEIVFFAFYAFLYLGLCWLSLIHYQNAAVVSASFWASQIYLWVFLWFNYLFFFKKDKVAQKVLNSQPQNFQVKTSMFLATCFWNFVSLFILFTLVNFVCVFVLNFAHFKTEVLRYLFKTGDAVLWMGKTLLFGGQEVYILQCLIFFVFFYAFELIKKGLLSYPAKPLRVYSNIGFIMCYIIFPTLGYNSFGLHVFNDSPLESGIPTVFNITFVVFLILHTLWAIFVYFSYTEKVYENTFLHRLGFNTVLVVQVCIYYCILGLLYRFGYYLYNTG